MSTAPPKVVSVAKSIDSPQFRSWRGQLGAYMSWARAEDRTAYTLTGRRALLDKFEEQVDPEVKLTIQQRAKYAEYALKTDMQRMALKAPQVRRGRRQP
jgi:hypothetical protein